MKAAAKIVTPTRSRTTTARTKASTRSSTNKYKPGDILGFSGDAWSSAFINLATYGIPWWSISHVAIVARYHGDLYLFESTTLTDMPCAIRGVYFEGTQAHRIDERVESYRGKVWHYPLHRTLTSAESRRQTAFLVEHLGVPYDSIGAFRSGGTGFSWVESWLRPADLSSLFCSEYVVGSRKATRLYSPDNISRFNPNRIIRLERSLGILDRPIRKK